MIYTIVSWWKDQVKDVCASSITEIICRLLLWSSDSPPHIPILGLACTIKSQHSLQETCLSVSNRSTSPTGAQKVQTTAIRCMCPTFAKYSIVPTKGRGIGPGIPSFLNSLYGQTPYLHHIKTYKQRLKTFTVTAAVEELQWQQVLWNYSQYEQGQTESQQSPSGRREECEDGHGEFMPTEGSQIKRSQTKRF